MKTKIYSIERFDSELDHPDWVEVIGDDDGDLLFFSEVKAQEYCDRHNAVNPNRNADWFASWPQDKLRVNPDPVYVRH